MSEKPYNPAANLHADIQKLAHAVIDHHIRVIRKNQKVCRFCDADLPNHNEYCPVLISRFYVVEDAQ